MSLRRKRSRRTVATLAAWTTALAVASVAPAWPTDIWAVRAAGWATLAAALGATFALWCGPRAASCLR